MIYVNFSFRGKQIPTCRPVPLAPVMTLPIRTTSPTGLTLCKMSPSIPLISRYWHSTLQTTLSNVLRVVTADDVGISRHHLTRILIHPTQWGTTARLPLVSTEATLAAVFLTLLLPVRPRNFTTRNSWLLPMRVPMEDHLPVHEACHGYH